jgi:hypothetical protein
MSRRARSSSSPATVRRVARIVPERTPEGYRRLTPTQDEALAKSIAWVRRGWPLGIDHLDRNSLYDDARGKREEE